VGPRNKGPTWFVQLLNKVYLKEKSSRAACQETELFSFFGLPVLRKDILSRFLFSSKSSSLYRWLNGFKIAPHP
jgi:hypothetical protein